MTETETEPAVRARGPMDGDEFHACLVALDWTGRGVAERLGVTENTIRQWRRGRRAVPEPVAKWLRTLARVHLANPPPQPPGLPGGADRGRGRPPGGTIWCADAGGA